jgi:hypothetical protein
MRLSEKEFQLLCAKSPALAAHATVGKASATPKYRNVKVYIYADGFVSYGEKVQGRGKPVDVFDSTKEYNRWNELQLLQRAGKISALQRQVKIVIQDKTVLENITLKEIAYRADFVYNEGNKYVVEDVKPLDNVTQRHKLTKDFALKWKLLQVKYPTYTFRIY